MSGDDLLIARSTLADESRCAFCAKSGGKERNMFAGVCAWICDRCVVHCYRMMDAADVARAAPAEEGEEAA